jgi:hypothetical protein
MGGLWRLAMSCPPPTGLTGNGKEADKLFRLEMR